MTFTDEYASVHHLKDGRTVLLRLLRPSDRDWLLTGFDALSQESRYRRFFTAMPRLPSGMLQPLLSVDGWNRVAVVAEGASDGEPLGIARFFRLDEDPAAAEIAVAVADRAQRHGLGELLLSVLDAAALERGIVKLRAEVLRSNDGMRALLRKVYADVEPVSVAGGVVVYEATLGPS